MTSLPHNYPLLVEGLTKRYGRRTVIDSLTFAVEPGRITGFLGPNGSGKSTTMKILLDLAAADHGTATIGGSTNAEISDTLYIGAATVKTHVSNILTKLGLRDRAQAVVFAYESGLITPGHHDVGH